MITIVSCEHNLGKYYYHKFYMIIKDRQLIFLAYFFTEKSIKGFIFGYLIERAYINYGKLQTSHFIYGDKKAAEKSK